MQQGCDGAGSHPNSNAYPPDRLKTLREEEARQASAEDAADDRHDAPLAERTLTQHHDGLEIK
jgi:hypothetical protein